MQMKSHTLLVPNHLSIQLKTILEQHRFSFETSVPHTKFRAKRPGVTVTLYNSGKCLCQGKDVLPVINLITTSLGLKALEKTRPSKTTTSARQTTSAIGSDESGKGDVFGGICVAGVFIAKNQLEELQQLGITDSKKISNQRIHDLAEKIRSSCPHTIINLNPNDYNTAYANHGNLNLLLKSLHMSVLKKLSVLYETCIIYTDQFYPKQVTEFKAAFPTRDVIVCPRAESQYLSVGAASILARDSFVKQMNTLSDQLGFKVPLGASFNKDLLIKTFKTASNPNLKNYCKTHFKTIQQL